MTVPKVPLAALETAIDRLAAACTTTRLWILHHDAGSDEHEAAVAWQAELGDLHRHAVRVLANHPKELR